MSSYDDYFDSGVDSGSSGNHDAQSDAGSGRGQSTRRGRGRFQPYMYGPSPMGQRFQPTQQHRKVAYQKGVLDALLHLKVVGRALGLLRISNRN